MKHLEGQKFGYLTALEPTSERKNRHIVWKCQCDCGNICYVPSSKLTGKETQSCGCLRKEKVSSNLVGEKIGKLTVVSATEGRIDRSIVWKCLCDCGNIIYRSTDQLKNPSLIKSCGCDKYDLPLGNYRNIAGERFGRLIALEPTTQRGNNGSVIWKCQCDCGNTVYTSERILVQNEIFSCGCARSRGETRIAELLSNNNIPFERQKTFESCRFPDSGAKAKFDFYVNNQYLIEFDGEQHFSYKNSGWNTKENFEQLKARDEYKNTWCKENNIPLIRIPYTKLKDLCLEDLIYHG